MRLLNRRDLELTCLLAFLTLVALLAPKACWPAICLRLAKIAAYIAPGRRHELTSLIPAYLPKLTGMDSEEIVTRLIAHSYEENLNTLREHLPGGWHPELTLVGYQYLDNAMRSGSGAILWVAEFEFSPLVTKKAFFAAGCRVVHLSRPGHGFGSSEFARRFLNPIQTKAEDQYLKARLLIDERDKIRGLRLLRQRLEEGEIVSITQGRQAVQTCSVRLFDGRIQLATGPVSLARATGRPLLPVFTLRAENGFEVHIEPELEVLGRDNIAPFEQYGCLIESYIERGPFAWRGWSSD